MKKLILVAVLCTLSSGCSTISRQAKEQIAIEAAARRKDYEDWDKLTELQKRESAYLSAKGSSEVDYSVNGHEIPKAYKTETTEGDAEPPVDERAPRKGQ